MAQKVYAGKTVNVNDEGYMTVPSEWDKDIAVEIAREEGLNELTSAHWQVIDYCRNAATTSGAAPTMRQITTNAGITTKDLFTLFPKGPAKKVARIAGLGKPEGCI